LVYQNAGPSLSTGVVITDIVPTAITGLSFTFSGATITDTGYIPPYVWDVQPLAPGAGGTITIFGTLVTGLPAGSVINNTASIAAATTDTLPGNNQSSASLTVLNAPPQLNPIGDQVINELALLSFTATATDLNGEALTFSLDPGAPAGAAITAGGVFTWTPSEAQGPGAYPVTVRVTDGGLADDFETIQITVNEVNQAPVLDPIGDRVVDELTLLTFTATASDGDLPANTLTFSLGAGAPAGASLTTAGVFTWTPSEAQGAGVYTVTFIVTDNGLPNLSDSETINITVNEVNFPPVPNAGPDQTVWDGTLVAFNGSFTDPDPVDTHTITWDFGDGFTASSTLTPTHTFPAPGVYTVTLTVVDNLLASGSDTAMVTVNLIPQADVSLALTASATQALACTTLVYTLTASNAGPQDASGVLVTLALPNEVNFVSAPAGCTANSGMVTCSLSSLGVSQNAVLPIYTRVAAAGSTLATASIAASEADPDPQNNSAAFAVETLAELTVLVDTFEGSVSGTWLPSITSVTPTGRGFLGEFSNETVGLTLGSLPAHCSVNVTFALFTIRSWDGNQVEWDGPMPVSPASPAGIVGPDSWQVAADGLALLTTTFSNWDILPFMQSYPGPYLAANYPAQSSALERDTLGYTFLDYSMDAVYHLTLSFSHASDSLSVDFSAWGLQPIEDESWGLDNVTITLGGDYTPPSDLVRFYLPVIAR
jgi:uncharacterized repeat protein (TIGR01451 family)